MLLHLLEHSRRAERPQVPPELTREGIAQAASIHLKHVTVYVRSLMKDGLANEKLAHVADLPQRRKVYELTEPGWREATRLRDRMKEEVVPVRDDGEERQETVGAVLATVGGKACVLDVLRHAQEGPVDLAVLRASPRVAFVERIADAPRLGRFVGRQEELAAILAEGDGPRLFVVRGVPGIGKTSLAARACELLRGKRNLFWHRVRSWDTSASLFADLADFLKACGKPKLRAVLARGEIARAPEVFGKELPGSQAFLVLDDLHEAGAEAMPFFRCLREALAASPDVKGLFLSRKAVPFYDRRDVVLDSLVRELDLSGLGEQDVERFFADVPEARSAIHLGLKLGGHPLFLDLVRAHTHSAPSPEALRDVERFVEEAIYSDLSEPERRMTKLASLYEVPIPREALFLDAALNSDVLLALWEQSVLRRTEENGFGVHDTVRAAFLQMMSAAERDSMGRFAVDELRRMAARAEKASDLPRSISCLSNALALASSSQERRDLLESLAEAYVRVGDHAHARTAFEDTLRLVEDESARTRILIGLGRVLHRLGEYDAALAACEDALRAVGGRGSAEEALALHVLGTAHAGKGNQNRAVDCLTRSLSIRERLGNEAEVLEGLNVLGGFHVGWHQYDQARPLSERSLSVAERIHDERGIARALNTLAITLYRQGNLELGLEHLQRSLSICERIGDHEFIERLLINIGNVHGIRGDSEQAYEFYRRALSLCRKTGDDARASIALMNLGVADTWHGEYEQALQFCGESISISESLGSLDLVATCTASIAFVHIIRGEYGRAIELSERSLSISEKIRYDEITARSLRNLALIETAMGDPDRATELGNRSLTISERVGDPEHLVVSLEALAFAALAQGNRDAALRHSTRALELAQQSRYFQLIALSQLIFAEASREAGDGVTASRVCKELLELAARPSMKTFLPRVFRLAGCLERDGGRWSESIGRFEESLRIALELGGRHEEARTHFEYGLLCQEMGDLSNAREHLAAAADLSRAIGARGDTARAMHALGQLSGGGSPTQA